MAIAVLMLMLSRKRSGKLSADKKQREMMLSMGCNSMHRIKQMNTAIAKKAVDRYSQPPGDVPHGVEDSFGNDNMTEGDSCQTNLVLLCPILELKLIGLDSVHAVLVDVETEQVETRKANNLVSISLLY
jgi:hypothetical protein